AVEQHGLSRCGRQHYSPAGGEHLPPRRLIGFGHVDFRPAAGGLAVQHSGEGLTHNVMRSFPGHQRRGIRRLLGQRNAEDIGMRLLEKTPLLRPQRQQTIDMRGVAVTAEPEGRFGFLRRGLRVAW
ncbi:MAG: hypothetical protein ACK56I_31440, partial [bacterium]